MQCTGSTYVVEPQSGFLELLLIAHVPSFMTLLSFHGRQFGSLFEAPSGWATLVRGLKYPKTRLPWALQVSSKGLQFKVSGFRVQGHP